MELMLLFAKEIDSLSRIVPGTVFVKLVPSSVRPLSFSAKKKLAKSETVAVPPATNNLSSLALFLMPLRHSSSLTPACNVDGNEAATSEAD